MLRRISNTHRLWICPTARLCFAGQRCCATKGDEEDTALRCTVQFAAASSEEATPRMAANEAFDLACNALSTTPNFCWFFISMDHAEMDEAPEVLWHALRRVNGAGGGNKAPQNMHMLGAAVTNQRIDGGYVRVMLGSIPDLELEAFTLDSWPKNPSKQPGAKPVACLTSLDARVTLTHMPLVNHHISDMSSHYFSEGIPTAGCILSPAKQTERGIVDEITKRPTPVSDMSESLAFVDDRVFRGSAMGVLLRSNMISCDVLSHQPSIVLHTGVVGRIEKDAQTNGGIKLLSMKDGTAPTELVKQLYETQLKETSQNKVFIALKTKCGSLVPLSFRGFPEEGTLSFLPPANSCEIVENETEVHFVCDETFLDEEAIATQLVGYEKKTLSSTANAKMQRITTQGEGVKEILASNTAVVHFSQPNLNRFVEGDDKHMSIDFGGGVIFAPSIAKRCLQQTAATTGIFCPGQILPFSNVIDGTTSCGQSFISSRSAAHLVLRGKE